MDKIKSKLLGLLLIPILSYGQEFVSVCDRTPQVKDAIMDYFHEIDDSIECGDTDLIKLMLPEIETLDLESGGGWFTSDIDSLKQGDFSGLSSLKRLDISSNNLTTLPQNIFSGLSSLEYLNLSDNDLTTLPQGIFSDLHGLEWLRINHNQITTLPLPYDMFSPSAFMNENAYINRDFSFYNRVDIEENPLGKRTKYNLISYFKYSGYRVWVRL